MTTPPHPPAPDSVVLAWFVAAGGIVGGALGSVATILTGRWAQRNEARKIESATVVEQEKVDLTAEAQRDNSEQRWAERYEDRFAKYEALFDEFSLLKQEYAKTNAELKAYRELAEGRIVDLHRSVTERDTELERLHTILAQERKAWGDQSTAFQLTIQAQESAHQHTIAALAILSTADGERTAPEFVAVATATVKEALQEASS